MITNLSKFGSEKSSPARLAREERGLRARIEVFDAGERMLRGGVARFLDTNVLLFSASRNAAEAAKRERAIARIDAGDNALSVQVLRILCTGNHTNAD